MDKKRKSKVAGFVGRRQETDIPEMLKIIEQVSIRVHMSRYLQFLI